MPTGTASLITTAESRPPVEVDDSNIAAAASTALEGAVTNLLAQQEPQGHWCGELEGDSILQSEYILLKWIIEQEDDPRLVKIANYLRRQQRAADGAWIQYPGAKPDLSATVKAYFALKLMGDDINGAHMEKARRVVLSLGGAEKCTTYTRFYLAALGQMHYDNAPTVPPEMILLPKWFYFHLDKVSAWSRTMIMPLSIISHYRPLRQLPEPMGIMELYKDHDYLHRPILELDQKLISWKNLFVGIDKMLKVYERIKIGPVRKGCLQRIEHWILKHTRNSDGLGAIYPPMVYIIIALRCLGYTQDNRHVAEAEWQLDRLMIEEDTAIRIQPCFSPIWDTGIAVYALTEAGLDSNHPSMDRACKWLVSKECRQAGDWKNNVPGDVEPSGWYFEFNNAYFPDVDDTAMVIMALGRAKCEQARAAVARGVAWIQSMQNADGGWAAFDRTINRPILEHIPFADHNAIQDPSCPDITGRTLECLGHLGVPVDQPSVVRAMRFLKFEQEKSGGWFGRWGVNYIYGTWQVLCGLKAIGADMNQDWIRHAGHWIKSVQKADGSFGELADSYEDPSLMGQGPSTPSQTAWGTMAIMSVWGHRDSAVQAGVNWLCQHQLNSGTWTEQWFTGTGFPRIFYLRYHLYRLYFPIMCLGRFRRACEAE